MRSLSRWMFALALLALPFSARAQIVNPVWTAVASTGTIDETNYTPVNFAMNGTNGVGVSSLSFLGASIMPAIVARYNVTNLAGVNNPAWTTLELGAIDTSGVAGNQVVARLILVKPCTGTQTVICQAISVTTPNGAGVCTSCVFPATTFNFTQNLYYVEVSISRTAATVTEAATTLRIF